VKAVVTVAIAVSAVLFAAFYLWFKPDWWIALLYAAICLLAIVSVPLLYRLFGYVDIDAIRELQQLEQKDHDEMMGRLSNLKQRNKASLTLRLKKAPVRQKHLTVY